jgi:exodeoxyribonuclease V alpha subunit
MKRTDIPKSTSSSATSELLSGVLERITFQSDESGFTVARLQADDHGDELVTIVGVLSDAPVGSGLKLSGRWQRDPRHGLQFKFDRYQVVKPNTIQGMEKYLGSGLIKGVGPAYAAKIVKHFGMATLAVLDQSPERLSEVSGLGRKLIDRIKEAWQGQRDVHEIMVFLQGHNIPAAYAVKIYKTYGRGALQVVKENPYRLTEDIWGIGFRIADRIAVSVGLPTHDPGRIRAGLLFVLNEAVTSGHCYLERQELFEKSRSLLDLPVAMIEARVLELVGDEKIVVADGRVYLSFLYHAERGVANSLLRIGDGLPPWGKLNPVDELRKIRQVVGFELAPEQSAALGVALENRLVVLTGGPGTGKSTILKAMILMLEKKGVRIALAAPTGRAAKRLGEATGREASTIHRLLGFTAFGGGFSHDSDKPLAADLVVVDEVSMLDIVLANALLRAIPAGGALLLVGDGDQLPSVGPGNFLRDLVACGLIRTVRLTRIFRQDEGSLISINAALINSGKSFDLLPDYKGDKDFYFIARETPEEIEREVVSLCAGRLAEKYGFDSKRDIQVLTPMHKGLIGVENLNRRLQDAINGPGGRVLGNGPARFRLGDKVMQLRNNYEKEVFNGDMGFVTDIDDDEQIVTVAVDGRSIRYEAAEINELQLAYAVTIHKSQGSEFPCVILPIHTVHYPLLQRNLLYTGITRGRKLVVVVGSPKALTIAIGNNRVRQRNSGLRERLLAGVGEL